MAGEVCRACESFKIFLCLTPLGQHRYKVQT
jgi:hypothetical protein